MNTGVPPFTNGQPSGGSAAHPPRTPTMYRLLLGVLLAFSFTSSTQAVEVVQVLVVHSYSQENPWTHGQHQGFVESLRSDSSRHYDVRVEYLDTKRVLYRPDHGRMFAEHLRSKYAGYRPAALYVSDDNALIFALDHLASLFPGTPVFFSGINDHGVQAKLDPGA